MHEAHLEPVGKVLKGIKPMCGKEDGLLFDRSFYGTEFIGIWNQG